MLLGGIEQIVKISEKYNIFNKRSDTPSDRGFFLKTISWKNKQIDRVNNIAAIKKGINNTTGKKKTPNDKTASIKIIKIVFNIKKLLIILYAKLYHKKITNTHIPTEEPFDYILDNWKLSKEDAMWKSDDFFGYVVQNNKYGLVSTWGRIIVPCVFSSIKEVDANKLKFES